MRIIVVIAIRDYYISEEAQIVASNGSMCEGKSFSEPDSLYRAYFNLQVLLGEHLPYTKDKHKVLVRDHPDCSLGLPKMMKWAANTLACRD